MVPCCAVLCLILGSAGLVLFVVGFSLPYWLVDGPSDQDMVSHGMWQSRICQAEDCSLETIIFGISAEFEAGRVFSCATIVMGLLSFFFTIFLVGRPRRVWAIRSSAVWCCTALFNLLEAGLVAGSEKKTLKALNLPGVSADEAIGNRLGWGYWLTVASLCIFVLTAICCATISCTDDVRSDDKSDTPLTKKTSSRKRDRTDRVREIKSGRTPTTQLNAYQHAALYPKFNGRTHDELSLIKTRDTFPSLPRSTNDPSIYSVNKTENGYAIYPSRAGVNIDNHRMKLNALDTPHYSGTSVSDYSTSEKIVLNQPSYSPSTASGPVTLSIPKSGQPYGESVYSLNVTPRGVYQNVNNSNNFDNISRQVVGHQATSSLPVNTTHAFTMSSENPPPTYSTLPRPTVDGDVIATLKSADTSTMVTTALIS